MILETVVSLMPCNLIESQLDMYLLSAVERDFLGKYNNANGIVTNILTITSRTCLPFRDCDEGKLRWRLTFDAHIEPLNIGDELRSKFNKFIDKNVALFHLTKPSLSETKIFVQKSSLESTALEEGDVLMLKLIAITQLPTRIIFIGEPCVDNNKKQKK